MEHKLVISKLLLLTTLVSSINIVGLQTKSYAEDDGIESTYEEDYDTYEEKRPVETSSQADYDRFYGNQKSISMPEYDSYNNVKLFNILTQDIKGTNGNNEGSDYSAKVVSTSNLLGDTIAETPYYELKHDITVATDRIVGAIKNQQHEYKVGYLYSKNNELQSAMWRPTIEEVSEVLAYVYKAKGYASLYTGYWNLGVAPGDKMKPGQVLGIPTTDSQSKVINRATKILGNDIIVKNDVITYKDIKGDEKSLKNHHALKNDYVGKHNPNRDVNVESTKENVSYDNYSYSQELIPDTGITWSDAVQVLYKAYGKKVVWATISSMRDSSITPANSPLSKELSNVTKFDNSEGAVSVFVSRSGKIVSRKSYVPVRVKEKDKTKDKNSKMSIRENPYYHTEWNDYYWEQAKMDGLVYDGTYEYNDMYNGARLNNFGIGSGAEVSSYDGADANNTVSSILKKYAVNPNDETLTDSQKDAIKLFLDTTGVKGKENIEHAADNFIGNYNGKYNDKITGEEFMKLAVSFMKLYGEPVISKKEENLLLQAYGYDYPTQLGKEAADAWVYMKARGILNVDLNYTGDVTREQLLDVAMCIADKDSRTDFKKVTPTISLDEKLIDKGYYPVSEVYDTPGATLNQKMSYEDAAYWDYFINADWELTLNRENVNDHFMNGYSMGNVVNDQYEKFKTEMFKKSSSYSYSTTFLNPVSGNKTQSFYVVDVNGDKRENNLTSIMKVNPNFDSSKFKPKWKVRNSSYEGIVTSKNGTRYHHFRVDRDYVGKKRRVDGKVQNVLEINTDDPDDIPIYIDLPPGGGVYNDFKVTWNPKDIKDANKKLKNLTKNSVYLSTLLIATEEGHYPFNSYLDKDWIYYVDAQRARGNSESILEDYNFNSEALEEEEANEEEEDSDINSTVSSPSASILPSLSKLLGFTPITVSAAPKKNKKSKNTGLKKKTSTNKTITPVYTDLSEILSPTLPGKKTKALNKSEQNLLNFAMGLMDARTNGYTFSIEADGRQPSLSITTVKPEGNNEREYLDSYFSMLLKKYKQPQADKANPMGGAISEGYSVNELLIRLLGLGDEYLTRELQSKVNSVYSLNDKQTVGQTYSGTSGEKFLSFMKDGTVSQIPRKDNNLLANIGYDKTNNKFNGAAVFSRLYGLQQMLQKGHNSPKIKVEDGHVTYYESENTVAKSEEIKKAFGLTYSKKDDNGAQSSDSSSTGTDDSTDTATDSAVSGDSEPTAPDVLAKRDNARINTTVITSAIMNKNKNILVPWTQIVKLGLAEPLKDNRQPTPNEIDGIYYLYTKRGTVKVNPITSTILIGTTFYNFGRSDDEDGTVLAYEHKGEMYFDIRCFTGITKKDLVPNATIEVDISNNSIGVGQFALYNFDIAKTANVLKSKKVPLIPFGANAKDDSLNKFYPKLEYITKTKYDGVSFTNKQIVGDRKSVYWGRGTQIGSGNLRKKDKKVVFGLKSKSDQKSKRFPSSKGYDGNPNSYRISLNNFNPIANYVVVIDSKSGTSKAKLFTWYPREAFSNAVNTSGGSKYVVDSSVIKGVDNTPIKKGKTTWKEKYAKFISGLKKGQTKRFSITLSDLPTYGKELGSFFAEFYGSDYETKLNEAAMKAPALGKAKKDELYWFDAMSANASKSLYEMTSGGVWLDKNYVIREFDISSNSPVFIKPYSIQGSKTLGVVTAETGNKNSTIYWLDGIGFVYNVPRDTIYNQNAYLDGRIPLPIAYNISSNRFVDYNIDVIKDWNKDKFKDSDAKKVKGGYGWVPGDKFVANVFTKGDTRRDLTSNGFGSTADGVIDANDGPRYLPAQMIPAPMGSYVHLGGLQMSSITGQDALSGVMTSDIVYYGHYPLLPLKANKTDAYRAMVTDSFTVDANSKFYKILNTDVGRDFYLAIESTGTSYGSIGGESIKYQDEETTDVLDFLANIKLREILDFIDAGSSYIILITLKVIPAIMLICITILVGLSMLADNSVWTSLCSKLIDPVKILTLGYSDVTRWHWKTVLIPCLILWCSFALVLNGNIFRLTQWAIQWFITIREVILNTI